MNEVDYQKAKTAYLRQKRHCDSGCKIDARGTPVKMLLTFEEWLAVWVSSGKLHLRGKTKDSYCMSRNGDVGHYEVGNVFIQPFSQNVRDSFINRKRAYDSKALSERLSRMMNDPTSPIRVGLNKVDKAKKSAAIKKAMACPKQKEQRLAKQKKTLALPHVKARRAEINTQVFSRPCTIDGITIFPSRKALSDTLGHGLNGNRSPNFRFI